MTDFKYDVAFSLASNDAPIVDPIASALEAQGFKVFYYRNRDGQGSLAFQNMSLFFKDVFERESRKMAMFHSRYYEEKDYCVFEGKCGSSRDLKEHGGYILPFSLDGTEIPYLESGRYAPPVRSTDEAVGYIRSAILSHRAAVPTTEIAAELDASPRSVMRVRPSSGLLSVKGTQGALQADYSLEGQNFRINGLIGEFVYSAAKEVNPVRAGRCVSLDLRHFTYSMPRGSAHIDDKEYEDIVIRCEFSGGGRTAPLANEYAQPDVSAAFSMNMIFRGYPKPGCDLTINPAARLFQLSCTVHGVATVALSSSRQEQHDRLYSPEQVEYRIVGSY